MVKQYKALLVALVFALLGLGLMSAVVLAEDLGPPYVVAVRLTGDSILSYSSVAVDPIHDYVYVVQSNSLAILQGFEVSKTVALGSLESVVVDAPRGYAYISQKITNQVRVFQGLEEIKPAVNLGAYPGAMAVLTTTGHTYVALPDLNQVVVLSRTKEITRITVGITPTAIAVNPSLDFVYVANYGDKSLSVIHDDTVLTTTALGVAPTSLAVDPATNYVYVSHKEDDLLSILENDTVTATHPITSAGRVAINSRTGRAYVLSSYSPSISDLYGWVVVLDGTTWMKSEPLAAPPNGIALDMNNGYVYITLGVGDTGAVTIFSNTVPIETFPLGQSPRGVALNSNLNGGIGYVPVYNERIAIFGRTVRYETPPMDPALSYTLLCSGTHDLPIEIQIPAGAVVEANTKLTCAPLLEAQTEPKYIWGGQAFRLAAYKDNIHQPNFVFAKPVTLTVSYDVAWLGGANQAELKLISRVGGLADQTWSESGITLLQRSATQIVVTLARVSDHAVVSERYIVYMPIILKLL